MEKVFQTKNFPRLHEARKYAATNECAVIMKHSNLLQYKVGVLIDYDDSHGSEDFLFQDTKYCWNDGSEGWFIIKNNRCRISAREV